MLSVLIVNWNTKDMLRCCLSSLRAHPPAEEHEVIVVDNDSHDGSADMVEREFPDAVLVRSGSNLGYAAGNNLAFSVARGNYLLTLNPDTEFEDASLTTALEVVKSYPQCGALGVKLVGPDKTVQKSVRGFPTILGIVGAWSKFDTLWPHGPFGSYTLPGFDYSDDGPAPQPMGTFLLFRRTALETVGDPKRPFDETFPIFFNEVDLLYRLDRAGFPSRYTARAHVLHHHGASTRQVRKSMIWESHISLVRYFWKHLKWPARALLPAISVAAWIGALVRAKGYHAGFRTQRHHL